MPLLVAVDITLILNIWPLYGAGVLPTASKAWVTATPLERGIPKRIDPSSSLLL